MARNRPRSAWSTKAEYWHHAAAMRQSLRATRMKWATRRRVAHFIRVARSDCRIAAAWCQYSALVLQALLGLFLAICTRQRSHQPQDQHHEPFTSHSTSTIAI